MLRSLPFSLSLSLSLSRARFSTSPLIKYQRADIYTIRQAIIDGRYISASWIGFNESYTVKFAHTQTLPIIIPLSSTDPKLPARTRVRASVFIRCRANAYVRWCVRTSQPHVYMQACTHARTHARTHAHASNRKRSHPPGLFRGCPSPMLQMMINGLINRFEFHVCWPRLREGTWNFILSISEYDANLSQDALMLRMNFNLGLIE